MIVVWLALAGCSNCDAEGFHPSEPLDEMFPVSQAEIDAADTNGDGTVSADDCRLLCERHIEMGLDSIDRCEVVDTDTDKGHAVHCTGTWRKWCYD